jgi:hypothetical protein
VARPVIDSDQAGLTRREAISTVGAVTAGLAIGIVEDAKGAAPPAHENAVDVSLRINGKPARFTLARA